nr:protein LIKE COV 2-like [Ipomoea batatas]
MKRVHCPAECQMCLVKDESAMHLFTECNFSNAVWRMSGLPLITSGFNSFAQWVDLHILKLDVDKCGLLLMLCWKIWTTRNDKIWNGKMASPSSLVEGTKCYLADWINIVNMGERNNVAASTKPEQKWERPVQGYLKLNIDAAVRPNNGCMGFGWVLRDEYGLFVAAGSIPGNGVFTPREVEAMAVREALSWIKDHGYSQVEQSSSRSNGKAAGDHRRRKRWQLDVSDSNPRDRKRSDLGLSSRRRDVPLPCSDSKKPSNGAGQRFPSSASLFRRQQRSTLAALTSPPPLPVSILAFSPSRIPNRRTGELSRQPTSSTIVGSSHLRQPTSSTNHSHRRLFCTGDTQPRRRFCTAVTQRPPSSLVVKETAQTRRLFCTGDTQPRRRFCTTVTQRRPSSLVASAVLPSRPAEICQVKVMAEEKDATSVPLSQAVADDPEDPLKSSPASSNSSTRKDIPFDYRNTLLYISMVNLLMALAFKACCYFLQSWVSKKFMTGCVVLFPVAVTFFVTWWFIQFVDGFFSPLYEQLGFDIFGLGFVTSLLFVFLVGVFVSSWLGATVFWIGEWLIKRMPFVKHIYSASKQISSAISPGKLQIS